MKQFILFLLFIPMFSFGQEVSDFKIIKHTAEYDIIKVSVGDLKILDVQTPNGIEQKVSLDKGSQIIEQTAPDLPKLAFSLIVPNRKDGKVEVLSSKFIDMNTIHVAPSKGKIYRHQNPDDFPYFYGDHYSKNEFYPGKIASLYKPYILRDFRGQALQLFPVQYNPVTNTLRKYTELTLKVSYTKEATENILNAQSEFPAEINAEFREIYKYHFLNYKPLSAPYSPLPQTGKMLILCDSKYQSAMPEFIEWKERKGYKVFFELTDTMTGGPSEANLFARVTQYYQQEQIAYLLIVGDATDIPAQNSYYTIPWPILHGPSDNGYAYQIGGDHYPDFIVGRFSGDTLQDVQIQVKRTLDYERNPNMSSLWMRKQVAMGSDQGPGDKGEYDYVHLRGIADSNKNFSTYVFNYEFFDGTHGGNDAPGNPPVNSLTDAINAGIGLVNYCGHGSTDIFITSTFTGMGEIPKLTNNNGQWPFIFSTACQNGNFVYSTCLGEAFLRANDGNGNPQGAIAALMSSINQSWDPPMEGQDEMNAILRGARPNTYQTTFGAIATSGMMSTNDHYNTNIDPEGGNEITDTWVVFGDPSVQLVTEDKGGLVVSHNTTIGKNSTSFTVQCNEEKTLVGLYYQGEFLASAIVVGGNATFNFPALQSLDTIYVTATKQNFMPYYGVVEVTNGVPFGVDELARENIQIYPNPATDILRISDKDNKLKQVSVFDMNGKSVLSTTDKKIGISNLAPGNYQIRIELKSGKRIASHFTKL